ncbi:hypothetical protein [Tenacibaculum sp. nBUS_03]|uniref:hypothetical protein n=1 Tax=Tenacibaculum sp. nBUS_03 TaxID=3395320 RepID=UPI003EB78903
MDVLFEIGNDCCCLRITKTDKELSVICGAQTLGWGEPGMSTLEETLKDQEQKISRALKNLDNTNRASKKGLEFLLTELNKDKQTILNL